MKKALAIMLSIIMLISMMPATVFAGNDNPAGNNGPADVDWAFIRFYYDGDDQATDIGTVYENQTAYNNAVPGATYDAASNTLTIDNYRHPENALSVNMMGNDFSLNVVGECELSTVIVWGDGWGGSITVTGDGALTVNENRNAPHAIQLNAEYVEASLTVDADVTLNLYGDEGVFSSYTNMFESPEDVVKALGGRDRFELNGAPFYYQNSQYIKAFEITDSQTEGYKGNAAVKQDDPDAYYGVSIWTGSSGQKTYHVSKYIHSQTYGVYLKDTAFDEQYGNDWGEVEFTKSEFDSLGFSMTVTGKELSSIFFFDSNAHSGPQLINANDPDGIYMLDHNGYSYSDQNDPATYTFKGTIYKLINGEYGYEKDTGFTPITIGQNDYEALPTGFTPVMDDEYQDLYLTGTVNEISGNLHVDSQDNEYIVYNNWNNGQSHEYVYAISEVPEIPGCYVATYVEDIAGVENHGYSEVTVPEDTGTYEFTTDVTEFSFTADYDWDEEHIIHFKDATVIDSDTVVFGDGNDAITLDVVNAQLDENGNILTYRGNELYNIEFVLSSNFDSENMNVYVLALDGYRGEMFINDGNTASFKSNNENSDDLHFPYEVYISLDNFIPYVVGEDSYGNTYMDGDTLILEQGQSVFVGFFTHEDNWLHGIFPSYGFNYGVSGEGNFADSLTSMGFTVTEGVGEDFNLGTDRFNGVYGCLITAPANLEAGTRARMPFSLYELPENFSWDDMWANFSWSDTPKVLENNMYIEVCEPWELYCNATVYTPGGFEKTVYDGTTLYIGPDETMFIQVNSDFELNSRYGVTNFYGFNYNQVVGDGYHFEFCDAVDKGYPDVGYGIYVEANGNMPVGQSTEFCFSVYYYPQNENDPIDYEHDEPAAKCFLNVEVREYNPCIYAVDSNGTIYNDGDTIYFGENETKAVAFRTDIRNADHGFYQDYIGWNTDVLEDAGFTIIDAGPAAFFNDYKDDFWADDFIFIISSDDLDYGTSVDFDTWLYLDPGENAEFDWELTPKAEIMTFNFKVGSADDNVTGDCTWSYDESSKKLTISGDGSMADYGFIPGANEPVAAPWSNYDIEKVVIEDGVTRIGSDAFMGLNIYDTDIADSVTSIGTNAFHGCSALDFVMLPPALTEVGAYAFYNTSLKEIEIPSTVTSIGQCAFGFYYDQDLDRDMPVDGFEVYGYAGTEAETYADTYGFTFHDNTVYLSRDGLWKYSIRPDGAAMLYSDVFQGYSYQGNDTVVTIPSTIDGYTVKELGAFSMSGLTNVTKITVPDSVESIGFSAFSGCTNLSELVLGNNITEIGAQVLDNTAIPYKDGAVYCNGYLLRVDTNCEGMFIVNPGTKLMAMFSFGNCNKIERIILPDSINKIDYATFVGCTSLKEILIPHSVGFIYDGAFTDYNEQTGQEERSLERIYGEPYTGAEAFANQNGIPFVDIYAIADYDLNGDYELTLADYQIARDYIAGNDLTIYGLIAGDVNDDGAVDAFDLFEIDKAMNANSQPKFTYTVDNNLAYINSYTGTDPVMVIPDSIDGYRIIELDANAFKNNTLITGAIVSGNVETIDNYAFMGCSNLERIDFASGLKSIKYGSFLNCAKLDNVILPDSVTSIGSYAFKGCTSLTTIQIPSSVTTIQATAFTGCTNLTIYGYAGSYAQSFATANNINFVAIG